MASIRKRGNSYLIVVSTGYDYQGNRRKSQQKTVKPPDNLTPKLTEKWLNEQAMIFEKQIKNEPVTLNKNITVAQYIKIFKNEVSPVKHAKSTQNRNKIEYERILPYLGHIKLMDLKAEDFRNFYAEIRKMKSKRSGEPLAEASIEGIHSVVCSILSSAMEQGYLTHNPAWRTYKHKDRKKKRSSLTKKLYKKYSLH